MKIKFLIGLPCLLLFSLTVPVIAWECDPPCEGCRSCEAGVCVDDPDLCIPCQNCEDGECVDDDELCFGCERCSFSYCIDENENCNTANCEECVGGICEVCSGDPNKICCDANCCDTDLCYDCNSTTGECEYQCDPCDCCIDGNCTPPGDCDVNMQNKIADCCYDAELDAWSWCCCVLDFGHCTTPCKCEEKDWIKYFYGGVYEDMEVVEGAHCADNPDCFVTNWRPKQRKGDAICFTTCQQCCVE